MTTYEFDVTVTVRKRLWLSGPRTKEAAADIIKQSLENGLPPEMFAKRGPDGRPIETILSNEIIVEDAK